MKMKMKQDNQDIALRVSNVSKSFKLPTERSGSLKNALFDLVRGVHGYRIQHVLKDISFEVNKGDFFGIVGRNGSGKSTLLKIISQIYTPDSGSVEVNGKLVPFIELGVGFNPELTGRENVYLNGAMLGFSHDEIDEMYDDIVNFAELNDFMEQKLKNYSSGMQVRLAFSVAIKSRGDILVLDEVLAVGDEAFQKKCQDYFMQAKQQKKTIILVTHSMPDVRKYCNKAMLIQDGMIAKIGDADEVASAYSAMFNDAIEQNQKAVSVSESVDTDSSNALETCSVDVSDVRGRAVDNFNMRENFLVRTHFTCHDILHDVVCTIDVIDALGRKMFSSSTVSLHELEVVNSGSHDVIFNIENLLPFGDYTINYSISDSTGPLDEMVGACRFSVGQEYSANHVMLHPKITFSVDDSNFNTK